MLAATISRGIHGSQSRRIPGHTACDETVGRLTALLDQAAVGTWALLPLLLLEDRSAFAALGRRPQKSGSESAMCAVPTTLVPVSVSRASPSGSCFGPACSVRVPSCGPASTFRPSWYGWNLEFSSTRSRASCESPNELSVRCCRCRLMSVMCAVCSGCSGHEIRLRVRRGRVDKEGREVGTWSVSPSRNEPRRACRCAPSTPVDQSGRGRGICRLIACTPTPMRWRTSTHRPVAVAGVDASPSCLGGGHGRLFLPSVSVDLYCVEVVVA